MEADLVSKLADAIPWHVARTSLSTRPECQHPRNLHADALSFYRLGNDLGLAKATLHMTKIL